MKPAKKEAQWWGKRETHTQRQRVNKVKKMNLIETRKGEFIFLAFYNC